MDVNQESPPVLWIEKDLKEIKAGPYCSEAEAQYLAAANNLSLRLLDFLRRDLAQNPGLAIWQVYYALERAEWLWKNTPISALAAAAPPGPAPADSSPSSPTP